METLKSLRFPAIMAAVIIGSFAAGAGVGHHFAARQVIHSDKIATIETTNAVQTAAYVGASVKERVTKTNWKIVTRWQKDGSVEQVRESQSDTKTESKSTAASSQKEEVQSVKKATREIADSTTIGVSRGNSWILGAFVMTDRKLISGQLPTFDVRADRRILGPIWLGLQVRPAPLAASVGISVSF